MRTLTTFLVILITSPARADIAPTTYEGMTLAPIESTEVEMREERVRITCDETCEVHAQFFMTNASGKPIDIYIGFPVGEYMMDNWKYEFRAEAGGATIAHFEKARSKVKRWGGIASETEWFGWPHTFPPGDSTVDVRYRIQPSPSYYNHFSDNIYYVLRTGSFWKGPIGRGVVEILFPRDVDPRQIDARLTTKGYSVRGRSVLWTFAGLEPDEKDDIHLEMLPHEIFDVHQKLARQLRAEPKNHALAIELARNLFPLSFHKGVTFYVPLSMTPADYQTTLALLAKDPKGEKLFTTHFTPGRECTWCAEMSAEERAETEARYRADYWLTEDLINGDYATYKKLIAALAAADFLPPDRRAVSPYALRGAKLLEHVLSQDPKNGEAWFLYLANYYRFKYSGYGPMYLAESPMQPRQIAVIERAHEHCPKHQGVARWFQLARAHKNKSKAGWQKALDRLQDYNDAHAVYWAPWLPKKDYRPAFRGLGR